jgi:CubicO group peptidase (beta-lactamase class C family)
MRLDTGEIERLVARKASPGCSVAIWTEEGECEFSCGTYSDTDLRKVDTHTLYDAASITKLFTASLVLRLHDSGKLGLDSRMEDYLPHFKGSALTVRDLLTHHARLVCAPLSKMAVETPDIEGMAARIPIPPEASPRFFYQNATFLFLGMLTEKLYGKPFTVCLGDLIRELGLRETSTGADTGLDSPPTEVRNGAIWAGRTHDESSYLCGGVTGYAGVFASASDLVKFGRAWCEFKIASPESTREAFSPYGLYPGEEQGLGWFNNSIHLPVYPFWLFCHSGFTGSLLAVNPAKNRVYAVNLNRTYYGRGNHLYPQIWAWVLERELTEAMTMKSLVMRMDLNLERREKLETAGLAGGAARKS